MRIKFDYSTAHFAKELHPHHGPQIWSWWRLFSISIIRLQIAKPHTGYRMWLYTRWGAAYFDVRFIRRVKLRQGG